MTESLKGATKGAAIEAASDVRPHADPDAAAGRREAAAHDAAVAAQKLGDTAKARLLEKYPHKKDAINGGVAPFGDPITSTVPEKVGGGWGHKTVSVQQKYRLSDNSIVPLDVE